VPQRSCLNIFNLALQQFEIEPPDSPVARLWQIVQIPEYDG
jgi:hypothetical protein